MRIKKKILSLILAILIGLNFNFTARAATTNKETEDIANVIYFVDFNDSEGNFMDEKMDRIKDMFNGEKDTSLSSYIKKISYNQMNVHNYFPQEVNGKITPYRLSNNRSDYSKFNEYHMISEVISNVQVDTSYNIDMNNDGYVDNVIFIFLGKGEGENDVFWPHTGKVDEGYSINGKKIGTYNLHNSSRLIDDTIEAEGVLAYEFLHSIGYTDLYAEDGTPVGIWDIMGSEFPSPQYPLAYTRSSISNWLTIDTITESGTYTLKPSSSKDGNQAFILKTPISNSEFFVVEYRKKGNPDMGELDAMIPGSGIIIYRVSTDKYNNYVRDNNYIYVFRPGEKGAIGGLGNLSRAFLSQESGRTSYGSEDFSKGISDNAITYTSGINSGIVINNVSEAGGDEITFDISFTDTNKIGVWNVLGNDMISNSSNDNNNIDVVGDKVYTVYSEGKKLKAKMYDGQKWISLGDNILNESEDHGDDPKIKVFNDIPYVLYHDWDDMDKVVVVKFQDNRWQKVQVISEKSILFSDMIATNSGLYITYTEHYVGSLKVLKLNTETNNFETLGYSISGNIVEPSLSEFDGELYVAFNDMWDSNKVYVKKFKNGRWVGVPGLNIKGSSVKISAGKNGIYLAKGPVYGGNSSEVYFYNGEAWSKVGRDFAVRYGNIACVGLDVYRGVPYVAYINNDERRTEVKYFDGTDWVREGLSVSYERNSKISLKISNGKAYVGMYRSGNYFVKFKSIGEEVLEDINGDGIIDLLDLSLVSLKYNLQSTDIGFDEKCDLNKDGIIDILDLVLISKKME